MYCLTVRIADHEVCFRTESPDLHRILSARFLDIREGCTDSAALDLMVDVMAGYGSAFVDYSVKTRMDDGKVIFERKDYCIRLDSDFRKAVLMVYDEFALKHSLMNLYSAFITYFEWGLLLHASCVIDDGRAYLFAGRSGAGKSTVARLSEPREIFSDEASIVKISENEITVYNSPFRSDTEAPSGNGKYPLAGIYLLHQALYDWQVRIQISQGFAEVIEKVFYWAYHPDETRKVWGMCKRLVYEAPVRQLFFRKQADFWNEIQAAE